MSDEVRPLDETRTEEQRTQEETREEYRLKAQEASERAKRQFQITVAALLLSFSGGIFLLTFSRWEALTSDFQAILIVSGAVLLMGSGMAAISPILNGIIRGEAAPYAREIARDIFRPTGFFPLPSPRRIAEIIADINSANEAKKNAPPKTPGEQRAHYETMALERMSDNLRALGERATLTLWAGILFAAGGVGLLFMSAVMYEPAATPDLIAFLRHYAPRLSITIIVELVAFFFLRTYARTLTDIRYVQNEFTNIEMKLIALHGSVEHNLSPITKKAFEALIATERNHVLEKGQTSLELERERMESSTFIDGVRAAADIMHARKGEAPKAE